MTLHPNALAECGDSELDERPGVQPVTAHDIRDYVIDTDELPRFTAAVFANWLDENWNDFNEDGDLTNGQVIRGALSEWSGQ